MKANCWYGTRKMSVEEVPDPKILNSRDAIVKITSTAICGSDLHLYNGYIPTLEKGDIVGHEFMGEVVETGKDVKNLKVGDRVVVPFPISCGNCFFCKKEMFSLCENSNPNAPIAEKMFGHSPCGIFGYSHMMGGFAGGQAEYARVPFADVGPFKIEGDLTDEQVLFLSDILPTGYMAAEQCNIQPGDTVAVWGCGPVGQFTLQSARLLGAERLIAIDRFPERLKMAQDKHGAIVINYMETDVYEAIQELTGGRGADATIDAVGLEGHAAGPVGMIDKMKTAAMMENGRPHALRQAIMCCRKGGTVSVPGVYGGLLDKMPIGAVVNKALTIKSGQTHVHRYMKPLFEKIQSGQLDATYVITHHLPLSEAPKGYEIFNNKQDDCIKIVLKPGM